MNSAADQQTGGRWQYAGLPDVTGMPLSDLLGFDGVLAEALNRVAREAATIREPLAAFSNYAWSVPPRQAAEADQAADSVRHR